MSGITQGTARFVFTNTFSGCSSDSSVVITVLSASIVSVTGPNPICVAAVLLYPTLFRWSLG
ncbi:MAG: hypothetical protein IPN49_13320 [Saprospiraceae bacterium]|nr:hypothetical protein [Saprospiraceae bacterium]